MKSIILFVSILLIPSGCQFDPQASNSTDVRPDSGTQEEAPSALRKTITITPPALPAGGIQDIPLAIILAADDDLAAAARGDGADIVFTAADGATLLDHEIERFVGDTGQLVAWVKIPDLSDQEPTTIHLHYGQPDAADRQDSEGTWSAGFRGVWHLTGDSTSGAPSEYPDSCPNRNHGRATGDKRPDESEGIAGPAVSLGLDEVVVIGDPADGSLDPGASSFSYSAWVSVTQSAGLFDLAWYNGGYLSSDAGYDFELGAGDWTARVADGTTSGELILGQETDLIGRWVHLVAVVDREANPAVFRAYVDGSPADSISIQSVGALSPDIGARIGDDTNTFVGVIDEVRVYAEALTDERVALEHLNLADPAALYTVGDQENAAYP